MTIYDVKGYAVLGPGANSHKSNSYVLAQASGLADVKTYALAGLSGGPASVGAYAVLSNPSSASASTSYAIHRNDVSVLSSMGYVVLEVRFPPYTDLSTEFPFCEERFPEHISYGSSGGPGFRTSMFTVDSGIAQADAAWDRIRARYNVEFDHVPGADIEQVERFFYGMRGKAVGFRFKDHQDYQIANQNVIIGDGQSLVYQLFKRYRSGSEFYDRMIRKPVRGTVSPIYLDGVEQVLNRDFFVNYSNGNIVFIVPPPAGAVGFLPYCEFDVPVRFDTDKLVVRAEDHDMYSISSLELIEILV